MQKVGTASIEDPSYVNTINTGVFQVSIGPICINAVRIKTRGNCGRSLNGVEMKEKCSKTLMGRKDFEGRDIVAKNVKGGIDKCEEEVCEWLKVTKE